VVRLASQTAAHKLVQIMGLLVIPTIVLLTLYFVKSKKEIDVLAQERAGVALAQWVLTAPEKLQASDVTKLARLEAAAGLLRRSQQNPISGQRNLAYGHYFGNIGMASHVMLDSEQDVHSLSLVAFELAPVFAQKINILASTPTANQVTDNKTLPQASLVLLAAGDVRSVLQRIVAELRAVGNLDPVDIRPALEVFYDADRAVEKVVAQFANPVATPTEKQQSLDGLKQAVKVLTESGVGSLQGRLLTHIDNRLGARSFELWRNLVLLMVSGLTSALAGIGLAVLMMRSSLQRVDEVEVARQDAVAARAEAETIAARFTAINADISRLNQDMAIKVKELKEAQEELIKKGRMEQLGQLIATIAHEVRNPLGAIRTTIFMVERKIADKGLGLEGHMQRINNSVNRCDTIISQLLDFSRTKEVNSSPILLDDWVAKTVREEAARLQENILIECALGLDDETVYIDPARMQRAIVNLLNNASEALLGQHDPASADTQLHHHIWVSTKRVGDHAVIRIADNGPGIAAEYIQKIREPLFTTKSFGTGLGIPAVEQVVNQHGGRLDISSDIGKGAVFSIYLPLSRRSKDAA
jgi:signal transduction histidine kinase